MTPDELKFIESNLNFSDPSAILIFLLMLTFSQFDNEVIMRDEGLYEKISEGHYRKVSVTLDQIKSQLETILGKELET